MVARKATVSSMNIQIEAEALRGHGAAPVFYQSSSQRSHNLFTAIQIFLCITESSFNFFHLCLLFSSPCYFYHSYIPFLYSLALSLPPFSVLYIFPCWGIMRASNSGWPCASHCIGVPWLIELANWKMPARPCRQHTVSVSLRKKRRRTHTIDFLFFSTSFHSARKTSVAHWKKMALNELLEHAGVQSMVWEGNKILLREPQKS